MKKNILPIVEEKLEGLKPFNTAIFFEDRVKIWANEYPEIKGYTDKWTIVSLSNAEEAGSKFKYLKTEFKEDYSKAKDKKNFVNDLLETYSKYENEAFGGKFTSRGFKWYETGKDLLLKDFLLFELGTADHITTSKYDYVTAGRIKAKIFKTEPSAPEETLVQWHSQVREFNNASLGWHYGKFHELIKRFAKNELKNNQSKQHSLDHNFEYKDLKNVKSTLLTLNSNLDVKQLELLRKRLISDKYIKQISKNDFIYWLSGNDVKLINKIHWLKSKRLAHELFSSISLSFEPKVFNLCVEHESGKKFDSNDKPKSQHREIQDIIEDISILNFTTVLGDPLEPYQQSI